MGIVDIHTHPQWGEGAVGKMAEVIRLARKMNVDKQVVLGGNLDFGFRITEAQTKEINDLTIDLVKRWPDELIGFVRLTPMSRADFLRREIDRCFATGLFKGVKIALFPNARSKRLDPVMRHAEQVGAVVLHHCWYKTVKKYEGESDPSDIADLGARFPKVPLIAAHLTAAGMKGVQDIRPYPNIYIDTSGSQGFSGIMEYAVAQLGVERILFGSDIPGRDFSVQLGRVVEAPITQKQKNLILWGNAHRLLGIQ